jgi:hypothetical protein
MKQSYVLLPFFPFVTLASDLVPRAVYAAGGFGLALTTCPSGTTSFCSICCPPGFEAVLQGSEDCGENSPDELVCCPNRMYFCVLSVTRFEIVLMTLESFCSDAFVSEPFCADSSLTLWNVTNTAPLDTPDGTPVYFCCEPGQIGTNNVECVEGSTNLAATLAAASVRSPYIF